MGRGPVYCTVLYLIQYLHSVHLAGQDLPKIFVPIGARVQRRALSTQLARQEESTGDKEGVCHAVAAPSMHQVYLALEARGSFSWSKAWDGRGLCGEAKHRQPW